MKVSCHVEDLLYGSQTVGRAVSNKNTLPILSGIMMQAQGNDLILRATDLEMAIECHIPAMVQEEGAVVIPGKNFLDLIRCFDEGDVDLTSEQDSFDLSISFGASNTKFRGMDVLEFPALPPVSGEISGSIAAPIFRDLVKQIAFAAATDEVRPVFSGVLMDITEDRFVMVATDTHRLAKTEGSWQTDGEKDSNAKVIIPARTMMELARLADDDNEKVQMKIGKNQIIFQIGSIVFVSRLINGQYPPYRDVIPKDSAFHSFAKIDTKRFRQEMERASVFARSGNNLVKFIFSENSLQIMAAGQDIGEFKSRFNIDYQGEELSIAYNIRYIMDILKIMDSEQFMMKLTGPMTPAVIIPEKEENEYLYLLLPVRIS